MTTQRHAIIQQKRFREEYYYSVKVDISEPTLSKHSFNFTFSDLQDEEVANFLNDKGALGGGGNSFWSLVEEGDDIAVYCEFAGMGGDAKFNMRLAGMAPFFKRVFSEFKRVKDEMRKATPFDGGIHKVNMSPLYENILFEFAE